tara:strand:+ start:1325 stop:2341 length:1017 start_codon:yes stop_codon:yes gene_type:complete
MLLKKKNYKKITIYWFQLTIFLIFSIIIVGGLTRLTDSGLSITKWELFDGIFPPLNNEGWIKYFNLYKEIPQFSLVNPYMSLDEFKIIFYWEYFHRLLGRFIGLFFFLPLIYFSFLKIFKKEMLKNLYLVFILILFQGVIGWYMVKSGLVDDVTVSHYRLSLHLSMAFIIISILFWNYLNLLYDNNKPFFNINNLLLNIFYFLILSQIVIGAFVSGLDAGLIYQTWPKMNASFFPDDFIFNKSDFFSVFNQQGFVQFIHRTMAYILIFFSIIIGLKYYFFNKQKYFKNYLLVMLLLSIQVFLGIVTLITGLNIYMASLHQLTSIFLVLSVLYYTYKFS